MIDTTKIREALENGGLVDSHDGMTHSPDCHLYHPTCCILRMADRIDNLRDELNALAAENAGLRGMLERLIPEKYPANTVYSEAAALLARTAAEPMTASAKCRAFNVQNCHDCDDFECGDNMNTAPEPAGTPTDEKGDG